MAALLGAGAYMPPLRMWGTHDYSGAKWLPLHMWGTHDSRVSIPSHWLINGKVNILRLSAQGLITHNDLVIVAHSSIRVTYCS